MFACLRESKLNLNRPGKLYFVPEADFGKTAE
jgi:hypothetical protein